MNPDEPLVTWRDRLLFQYLVNWEQHPWKNHTRGPEGGWRFRIYHDLEQIGLSVTLRWGRYGPYDSRSPHAWDWDFGVRVLTLCVSVGYSDTRLVLVEEDPDDR